MAESCGTGVLRDYMVSQMDGRDPLVHHWILEATLSNPRPSDRDVGEAALTRMLAGRCTGTFLRGQDGALAFRTVRLAFSHSDVQRRSTRRTESAHSELESELGTCWTVCRLGVETFTSTCHISAGPLEIEIFVLHHEPDGDGWRLFFRRKNKSLRKILGAK